jgi:hypothetical protein
MEAMQTKQELLDRITEIELEMFLSVQARGEASCQNHPDTFLLHRKAQFTPWSEDSLKSYLNDLNKAKQAGVNLMTLKYGRMENLIPEQNTHPLIEKIVSIQFKWQRELFEKYPRFMAHARPLSSNEDSAWATSFETYLKGELETYSDETLSNLYKDMTGKLGNGINMTEEVYAVLVKALGYDSIEEADQAQKPET